MCKDFSFTTVVAGFVAVLVGFTSSVAVLFQAAQNLSVTPSNPALILPMAAAYLLGRNFWPRLNVPLILCWGW